MDRADFVRGARIGLWLLAPFAAASCKATVSGSSEITAAPAAVVGAGSGGAGGTMTANGGTAGRLAVGMSGRVASATGGITAVNPSVANVAGMTAGSASAAGRGGAAAGAPATTAPSKDMGEVCKRWKADRANMAEGTWNGDTTSCNAGDMTPEARETTLRMLNLYRWMAGLAPVTSDPDNDQKAQQCALMMTANGMLSHTPPNSWKCYSADGASAAGKSNISQSPSVRSVDLYMIDPGNETTLGHRRWILSAMFGPTGIGGTSMASCLWTFGSTKAGSGPMWNSWPAQGVVPIQALTARGSGGIDATGWSVHSDKIKLAAATISVTSDGMDLPGSVTQLQGGYGSTYALRFNPMGWKTEAGKTYTVTVGGLTPEITYDVQVVDCND